MDAALNDRDILQRLEALGQELSMLQHLPERQQLEQLSSQFADLLQQRDCYYKTRKQARDQARSHLMSTDPKHQDLVRESQLDGIDRRRFKTNCHQALAALTARVAQADGRIEGIRQEMRSLRQQLQKYLRGNYVKSSQSLRILYEDDGLIAIDKPAGFRSVPGRGSERQESVLRDLQQVYPTILAVHRLDQDTSGVLLFAKDRDTARLIHGEFLGRRVQKRYEAILSGPVSLAAGTIELPLWGDARCRPYQSVDYERGKVAVTEFRVIDRASNQTRVEFTPITGRTHQLRLHAVAGLGWAIVGDRLYGVGGDRLYLHGAYFGVWHRGRWLEVVSPVPF